MKRIFFNVALAVLILSAVGKLIGLAHWRRANELTDPVFTILTKQQALLLASLLEMLIVGVVWRLKRDFERALALAWIGALFVTYRAALWGVGFKGYCGCLGYWTSCFHLSQEQADFSGWGILVFLLVGSGVILVHDFTSAHPLAIMKERWTKMAKPAVKG